jgi:hypothetical protein
MNPFYIIHNKEVKNNDNNGNDEITFHTIVTCYQHCNLIIRQCSFY